MIITAEESIAAAERRKAMRRGVAWRDLVGHIGIAYAGCNFANYRVHCQKQEAAMKASSVFADNIEAMAKVGRGLVLVGSVGTGKDHLLVATMRAAVARDIPVAWVDGAALSSKLWSRQESQERMLQAYCGRGILGISDPCPSGTELTPVLASALFYIVDQRYRHRLSTIVTLNAVGDQTVRGILGEPIADRLRERCKFITCKWESYRNMLKEAGHDAG